MKVPLKKGDKYKVEGACDYMKKIFLKIMLGVVLVCALFVGFLGSTPKLVDKGIL